MKHLATYSINMIYVCHILSTTIFYNNNRMQKMRSAVELLHLFVLPLEIYISDANHLSTPHAAQPFNALNPNKQPASSIHSLHHSPFLNKCSDRSREVQLPAALSVNNDKPTD